eukprot:gb/GECG01015575.1/.p1 GENE.gb/GECG01015575.1/~~gb/GECG01015575.1/.p1  ORF type:complete len:117 (+),score=11.37 gb/GECG01015575.1/:1-351(+)
MVFECPENEPRPEQLRRMNPTQTGGAAGGPQNMPAPAMNGSSEDIVNNIFGIVIPGRPLITQFKQAGPNKFLTEIQQPATAGELTLFLQPGQVLPPSTGSKLRPSIEKCEKQGSLL